MNYLGIEASVRNLPELDRDFFPLYKFNHAFLASAQKPVGVAVERSGGEMAPSIRLSTARPTESRLTDIISAVSSSPCCG